MEAFGARPLSSGRKRKSCGDGDGKRAGGDGVGACTRRHLSLDADADRWVQRLPADARLQLTSFLTRFLLTNSVMLIATACSGTDLVVHAVSALAAAFGKLIGEPFPVRRVCLHLFCKGVVICVFIGSFACLCFLVCFPLSPCVWCMVYGREAWVGQPRVVGRRFSCERNAKAREFIKRFVKPDLLFKDVTELHRGVCEDDMTGKPAHVPACHGFIAGIVCSSASSLNNHRQKNKRCVQEGVGGTGRTSAGVRAYVAKYMPEWVVLENVPLLDSKDEEDVSNLDELRRQWEEMGYLFFVVHMSPRKAGFPVSRRRIYIICIKRLAAPLAVEDNIARCHASLQSSCDPDFHLSELLVNNHSAGCTCTSALGSAGVLEYEGIANVDGDNVYKWEDEHEDAYGVADAAWPPDLEAWVRNFRPKICPVEFARLPRRQQELLHYWKAVRDCNPGVSVGDGVGVSGRGGKIVIIDLNPSFSRCKVTRDHFPCVVPSGRYWVSTAAAEFCISGEQAFLLQGWDVASLPGNIDLGVTDEGVEVFKRKDCMSLAGNAFEARSVTQAMLLALVHVEWPVS